MASHTLTASPSPAGHSPWFWAGISLVLLPVGAVDLLVTSRTTSSQTAFVLLLVLLLLVTLAQIAFGVAALVAGMRQRNRTGREGVAPAVAGAISALAAVPSLLLGAFFLVLLVTGIC